MMKIKEIQTYLAKMGLPVRDNYALPSSQKTFPDGAHFRVEELPTSIQEYEEVFETAKRLDLKINRLTDVSGIMLNSDREIMRKLAIAREHGAEVIMGPGAAEQRYDISQQAEIQALVEGKVRGMDQLTLTIQSMIRGTELGCRGFLMYDEGVLLVALQMWQEGMLPKETKFKLSANLSISNAAAIKFWFNLLETQDAINPIRDLTLPMLSAMRQTVDHPLDVHLYHRTTISRVMEAAEIVRVGAPLFLKNARFGSGITAADRVRYSQILVEAINSQNPEAIQSHPFAEDLAIPVDPGTKWSF